jgi:hypothetical protein
MLDSGEKSRQMSKDAIQLADDMSAVGSAVLAVNDIFADAEGMAKGMGKEGAGIAGGKTKEELEAEAKRLELLEAEKQKAAQKFAADMAALGQTEMEAERARFGERLFMLEQYNEQGLILGQAYADARAGIELEHDQYIAGLQADAAAREAEIRDRALQEDIARRQAYNSEIISGTSGLLGTIQGLFDESNAEQKAASKAFGVAQVAISTAVGIAKAFEQFGWPAGLAPAALVTASGVAQTAAILQAHQGTGPVYMHQGGGPAPDERDVRMLRTEPVLNSQAGRALGAQGVEALNSGRMPGAGELVINLGRTQTREVIREELRSGETQLRRYVSGQGSVAGFSGGRAVA